VGGSTRVWQARCDCDHSPWLGRGRAQPLGNHRARTQLTPRQEHHEFLAAIATEDIVGPELELGAAHRLFEHDVAGAMAVGVVDAFEKVDVKQDEAVMRALARAARRLALHLAQHGATVRGARQRVVVGPSLELLSSRQELVLQLDDALSSPDAQL
jgi:hypothetical protein